MKSITPPHQGTCQDTAILNRCHFGDALKVLEGLPAGIVNTCVTSPPYWGLRDYGHPDQLGLEATPEEYVARIVAIFREVRRVLRDDGTLWLNLGDSYAGARRGGHAGTKQNLQGTTKARTPREAPPVPRSDRALENLKPKDLVGIPWMVAKALQAPFYTGKIKSELDRVWLAAMIDGEGCMYLHKRRVGQNNGQGYKRKADSYGAGLEVANTHKAIVDRCLEITGAGSVCRQDKDRKQPLYRWNLRSNECREIIREIYPYLVGKQHQARLLLACPSSGKIAEAAHASPPAQPVTGLREALEAYREFVRTGIPNNCERMAEAALTAKKDEV